MDDRKLEAVLSAALYRRDCPDLAALSDYQMGRLNEVEQNRIGVHLERCLHCQAETGRLAEFLGQTPEPKWITAVGFVWARLQGKGQVLIRLLKEATMPPTLRLAPVPVKGRASEAEPEALIRINLSYEETGDAEVEAVAQRSQTDPQRCMLVVRVQIPSRWPNLKGTLVRAIANDWQASGYTNEAGEVRLGELPIDLLSAVTLQVIPSTG
jgi:hypothetical protein